MADRNDERIAPVALPAGQFELTELQKSLESAVSVKDREKHPERIGEAIAKTIKNPELLVAADLPALPEGAELVKTPIVYAEGQEPVERHVPTFTGVEAKDGAEAATMRYPSRGVAGTDEQEEPAATLAEHASERLALEEDSSSSRAGAKSK